MEVLKLHAIFLFNFFSDIENAHRSRFLPILVSNVCFQKTMKSSIPLVLSWYSKVLVKFYISMTRNCTYGITYHKFLEKSMFEAQM